jgi:hypothetical protein
VFSFVLLVLFVFPTLAAVFVFLVIALFFVVSLRIAHESRFIARQSLLERCLLFRIIAFAEPELSGIRARNEDREGQRSSSDS